MRIPFGGCPICGRGIDWSLWPTWAWTTSGACLVYFPLEWMRWEYVCQPCADWANRVGVRWDGKLTFKFTGYAVGR